MLENDVTKRIETMRRIYNRVTREIDGMVRVEATLLEKIGSYGEALVSESLPASQERMYLQCLQDYNKQYVEARDFIKKKRDIQQKSEKKVKELCEFVSQHHV